MLNNKLRHQFLELNKNHIIVDIGIAKKSKPIPIIKDTDKKETK
jgi:hypothetical protein